MHEAESGTEPTDEHRARKSKGKYQKSKCLPVRLLARNAQASGRTQTGPEAESATKTPAREAGRKIYFSP